MLASVVAFSLPLDHSVLHPHPCASSRVTCYEISRRPSPFRSATYKMLFPQLICFENNPSFMGVCTLLNEGIMNSTIANSSSAIDIPVVTSRNDSSLPHAPKEGRCQHIFPNGKRCRKFASGSHLGLCLQHLTESAAIGAGLQQPPNDSLDLSAELLPELSEFKCGVDINKFLARLFKARHQRCYLPAPRRCPGLRRPTSSSIPTAPSPAITTSSPKSRA